MAESSPPAGKPPVRKKPYVRSVSGRMRVLLYFIFGLVAVLAANSAYLSSVTAMEWFTGKTYQDYFYQYMFLAHLVMGLVLVTPFLIFGVRHMLAAKDRKGAKVSRRKKSSTMKKKKHPPRRGRR